MAWEQQQHVGVSDQKGEAVAAVAFTSLKEVGGGGVFAGQWHPGGGINRSFNSVTNEIQSGPGCEDDHKRLLIGSSIAQALIIICATAISLTYSHSHSQQRLLSTHLHWQHSGFQLLQHHSQQLVRQ